MDLKQLVLLALQVSIFATVFGFGLNATVRDVSFLLRRPGLLLRSLLSVFLIVPVLAISLTRWIDFRSTVEIVLIAIAISPVPPLLPSKEAKVGGDRAYGIALMATLGLLAIVFVPLAVAFLSRLYDRPFAVPMGRVSSILLVSTLIPLACGMAVRALFPRLAERLVSPVGKAAKLLLVLGVLALLYASWGAIWAAVGGGSVLALVLFVLGGLLVGHLMGGPDPDQAVVLALSSACRHPAVALSIAAPLFPEERLGGTILLYLLVSAVAGIPYLAWQRRRLARAVAKA